ncbi:MAG: hypothetical protein KAJ69_04390 [Thermoplasmatales archaeon]|nr:hypothetical protein [Thermoplasmatales archaeon]
MSISYKNSIARWYFYLTPLFILLDYFGGVNVRVSALDSVPLYKNLYYGFCILCGICMYIIPRYSAVVALFESSINFMMIVLGIFLQYVQYILYVDDILNADFKAMEASINAQSIVNLFIVGSCVILTFRKSIETIKEGFGFFGPTSKRSQESDTG